MRSQVSEGDDGAWTYILKAFRPHREPELDVGSSIVEIVVHRGTDFVLSRFEHCFGDPGIKRALVWSDCLPANP
jgi:hypothetical protein